MSLIMGRHACPAPLFQRLYAALVQAGYDRRPMPGYWLWLKQTPASFALPTFALQKCCTMHEWQEYESCTAARDHEANGSQGPSMSRQHVFAQGWHFTMKKTQPLSR